jgi:ATP-dependent Clp protease ATP-binding subunit ClpA
MCLNIRYKDLKPGSFSNRPADDLANDLANDLALLVSLNMKITVPIYIEQQLESGSPSSYLTRPLFFDDPVARDEELQRAIAKLVKALRREINEAGKKMWHNDLAAYSFAPEVDEQLLAFNLDLKTRKANCRLLFVSFNSLDRRIAFSPNLSQLWFEIERGEALRDRAIEVMTQFFRGKNRRDKQHVPKPEDVSITGKAWTSAIEIEVNPPLVAKTRQEELRALLDETETLDGEDELQQVGRCLDWLYPDELSRAVSRDRELDELTRLLRAEDRRPILIAGPRMVGKTALVEEFVFRAVAKRKSQYENKNNVWLIAPQRLISGMSYVGQWENRLIAILKEAKERDHILYFDDLVGLFKAGVSRDSKLNVAQVLKPYIERRDVRVLAEATPEAWRVLRELDRGFADLFHLLLTPEPTEAETVEMSLELIRQLEAKHHCIFGLEALPAVLDLQRRFVRDAAFPGKSAAFLRQLAIKHRGAEISRQRVIEEFQAKSGLARWMLVESHSAGREELIQNLRRSLIGQKAALEAFADCVAIAKARLNDPDRPLASFLFLGPTGVGKTQCAKAMAATLFGSEDRLIRFDMNEFVSPDAVAKLVGAFDQPEGLLTSAVRRQPFSVILLDEIEKANRDVFNLLLQVMGDGRLTDALGRTADFTNAIVILTSNLGVKEASTDLGFQLSRANEAGIYQQAAERFFSPEFFNRLDRVIPFDRLSRRDIGLIAYQLIDQLFRRDGLARRKSVLRIDERALEWVIDVGFHPTLGARALKRAIETQLTQPLAVRLSAMTATAPAVIDILPGAGGAQIRVCELIEAERHETRSGSELFDSPQSTIERIHKFVTRVEDEISVMRPEGAISLDAVAPRHQRYFALVERMRRLRNTCDWLTRQFETAARASSRLTSGKPRVPQPFESKGLSDRKGAPRQVLKKLFAAEDIHAELRELATQNGREDDALKKRLADAIRETALIAMLASDELKGELTDELKDELGIESEVVGDDLQPPDPDRAIFLLRSHLSNYAIYRDWLKNSYREFFGAQFGLETRALTSDNKLFRRTDDWLLLTGKGAARLAETEQGTHLFFDEGETLAPVQTIAVPLGQNLSPRSAISRQIRRRRAWIERLGKNEATVNDDPHPLEPVIRIYDQFAGLTKMTVDLRSGLTAPRFPTKDDLREFLSSSLELPVELQT